MVSQGVGSLPTCKSGHTINFVIRYKKRKKKRKERKRKGYKVFVHWKKEAKLSLFPNHVILYLENSNVSVDTLLEFIRQFKMLAAYSII